MSGCGPIHKYIYVHTEYILPDSYYKPTSIFNIISDCFLPVQMLRLIALSAISRTERINILNDACGLQIDKVSRALHCYRQGT